MKFLPLWVAIILAASGCATRRPDHFYALSARPTQAPASHTGFARQLSLHVTLPSLIDRAEMVLTSQAQVSIVEHERWGSPLLDQVTSTLGQDIEARRADVVVANRSLEQAKLPMSKVSIEVVHWAAERAGTVSIEVRWRITDSQTGSTDVGRDIFMVRMSSDGYDQIPVALSDCLAQLADKLAAQIPSS